MLVKINDTTYHVSWKYHQDKRNRRITTCVVSKFLGTKQYEEVCSGTSICHEDDRFMRNEGRKTTLSRALEATYPTDIANPKSEWVKVFNKEERTAFWRAYHLMRHSNWE